RKGVQRVIERASGVMAVLIVPYRAVGTDESKMVYAGLPVNSRAACIGERKHQVEAPQGGGERIAHSGLAAAETRIDFDEPVRNAARQRYLPKLPDHAHETFVSPEQIRNRRARTIRRAGGVIVLCEQREMFAFIACEIGYPIRRRRHIRSGEPDAWRATGDRRRETVEFGAEIRISITGFPMS